MKKKLKSPAFLAFGPVILGFIFTIVYDVVKKKAVFSTVWNFLKLMYQWIIKFLNFNIKVWWLLAAIGVLIIGFIIYFSISDKRHSKDEPQFLKYTKDNIMGWNMGWCWEKQYNGRYAIVNLQPFCSKCNTPLTGRENWQGKLECARCGYLHEADFPDENEFKIIISDNVKRRYFPDEV